MIIEQSKEQVDDSIEFHRHSEIGFVRLARARIWGRDRITRTAPRDVNFDIAFKPAAVSLDQSRGCSRDENRKKNIDGEDMPNPDIHPSRDSKCHEDRGRNPHV